MDQMRIDRGPREHLGRELDDVATEQMRLVGQRIGGLHDRMPRPDQAAVATCEDCGQEHTTYAAYRQGHRAEDEPTEGRYCLGCVARMVDVARPIETPAALLPGTCTEPAK